MQFSGLVSVRAATGAPAFLAVIVLTMLAVHMFDPRLIWDPVRS
jgi:paraquat-inducible protein A